MEDIRLYQVINWVVILIISIITISLTTTISLWTFYIESLTLVLGIFLPNYLCYSISLWNWEREWKPRNFVVLKVIFFLYYHLLRGVADFDTQDTLIRPFESTPVPTSTSFELAFKLLTNMMNILVNINNILVSIYSYRDFFYHRYKNTPEIFIFC